METKVIMAIPVLCLFLMSVKPFPLVASELYTNAPDLKIIGIYNGNEGYGCNFITKHKEDDSEFTMTFQKVNEAVMKEFNLDTDVFLNKKFDVTYTIKTVVTKDEDGFDNEDEAYTITQLKAL